MKDTLQWCGSVINYACNNNTGGNKYGLEFLPYDWNYPNFGIYIQWCNKDDSNNKTAWFCTTIYGNQKNFTYHHDGIPADIANFINAFREKPTEFFQSQWEKRDSRNKLKPPNNTKI